ncbi:DUF1697 domain-containing protein [Actinorugispora endophytica]|uniref:Uncharacterized protein (DUF1697 family) n=1 Tax=Actinorugispora endophytica TaxID=1605990 RepID=A0A4R6UH50_9ACTN|nr:DUF1697 domain-containing protein [Actinorugispora endophytica]TDQ46148.1 uncharacterized protein (DUF1697 family) [Actinorugispora endophytica]
MTRYAALLRGVNVGGSNRIAMADLRALLEGLGYTGVATLLQSGNAVLTAPEGSAEAVAADIEACLASELGLPVAVMVRTRADLRRVVGHLPFPVRDPAKCAVAFFGEEVDRERLAALDRAASAPEELAAGERELYLYLPDGLGRAKLPPLLARRLGAPFTIRNWATTTRLLALAEGVGG